MSLILITPPAVEPVSLAELKSYLRIDPDDDAQDGEITDLAVAARMWAEVYTLRRFVRQAWRLGMDFFPGYVDMKLAGQKVSSPFVSGSNAVLVGIRYAIALPLPPVSRIVEFSYQNANGSNTVMNPATDYIASLPSNPARLTPPFGNMWPVARVVVDAVQVEYEVGYAQPIVVTATDDLDLISSDYGFVLSDIGRPISIAGGGPEGRTLNTTIKELGSPSGAVLRDALASGVTAATALLVNNPNCNPGHWSMIKSGIKALTLKWFEKRMPDENNIPAQVKAMLAPVRDLRM